MVLAPRPQAVCVGHNENILRNSFLTLFIEVLNFDIIICFHFFNFVFVNETLDKYLMKSHYFTSFFLLTLVYNYTETIFYLGKFFKRIRLNKSKIC